MEKVNVEAFNIIGISVRTSNSNGQALKDITTLWSRLMSEDLINQIPNKIDNTIYSLYTEYEGDHTQPYTTILGCRVTHLEDVPKGMTGQYFESGKYTKRLAKGDLNKGVVANEWFKIWESDLDRTYVADFEIYDEKARDPANAEVTIFVGID